MDEVPVKGVQFQADIEEEFRPASEVFGSSELDYLDQLEAQGGNAADVALARQSLYVRFDPLVDSQSHSAHVPALPKSFAAGNDLLMLDTPEKVSGHQAATAARQIATPNLVSSDTAATSSEAAMTTPSTRPGASAGAGAGIASLLMDTPQASTQCVEPGMPSNIGASNSDVDLSAFSRPVTDVHSPVSTSSTARDTARPSSVSSTHSAHSPPPNPPAGEFERQVAAASASQSASPPPKASTSAATGSSDLIDVLKYSEADLEREVEKAVAAAIDQLKAEASRSAQEKMERIEALTNEHRNLLEKIGADEQQLRDLRQVIDEHSSSVSRKNEESKAHKHMMQKEIEDLSSNNTELSADINSLENSFADLHSRYERLRAAMETMRKNEAALRETEQSLRQQLEKAGETNRKLKEFSAEQVNQANVKMQKIVGDHRGEVAVLTANVKTLQVKADSLGRSLKQKEDENKELTTICEDMMKQMRR